MTRIYWRHKTTLDKIIKVVDNGNKELSKYNEILILLASPNLMYRSNCASGISDKDTVVVTDGELGKKLPNRNLEIGQEVQKGLTDEKMRGDFWI